MSLDFKLPDNQEVEILKNDLSGLNDVYRDIASEIGLENTLIIFKLFHGTQISFPNKLFSKEYTHTPKGVFGEYLKSKRSVIL